MIDNIIHKNQKGKKYFKTAFTLKRQTAKNDLYLFFDVKMFYWKKLFWMWNEMKLRFINIFSQQVKCTFLTLFGDYLSWRI